MTAKHAVTDSTASTQLASRANERVIRSAGHGRSIAMTGTSTPLGRRLVAELAASEYVSRIVVLDTLHPGTAGPKISFYSLDLTQPAVDARLSEVLQAEQVDTFVHLSPLESPIHATAWAHELERSGTMQVLHACHKRQISKLVVTSSTLVYGPHRENPNFLRESQTLRGMHGTAFVADKLDVEAQCDKWQKDHPESVVCVLRLAFMLGQQTDNYVRRFFSRTFVPSVLGYDPLVQFLHESDALAALKLAVERDVPGPFNIASEGVLRLSSAIRLAGRLTLPMPYGPLRRAASLLWALQLCEAPAPFVALLRHLCVADIARARRELGFRPRFSARDALLQLRASPLQQDAKLLSESP
jgi:UDP-glucose 4-epimerase